MAADRAARSTARLRAAARKTFSESDVGFEPRLLGAEEQSTLSNLLCAADERDEVADARDASADERDAASDLASFLADGTYDAHRQGARRSAAMDRLSAKTDRVTAAIDRDYLVHLITRSR